MVRKSTAWFAATVLALTGGIALAQQSIRVDVNLVSVAFSVRDASGSQEHFTRQHQHDIEIFLKDVLGPNDRVFLVGFGNHIRLVSDYSHSSAGLMEAWKRYDKSSGKFPE